MKPLILFLTLLLSLSSCQKVLLKLYGIKNPDIENAISIKKWANTYKLDTSAIVTVNSSDFLVTFKEAGGIPDAMVFDVKGNYIEYRQTDTSCNAGLFGFIPDLRKENTYRLTGKTTLQKELSKYRTLNGQVLPAIQDPAYDFYLLVFATKWTGKLNQDHVKIWTNLAVKNTKAKIKTLIVNLDFQAYWSKEEQDRIVKAFQKKK